MPFRSAETPTACTRCGAPKPDMLGPNGELMCKGCAMTAEADARLAAGKSAGRTGAVMAIVTGCIVLAGTLLFAVAASGGGRMVARIGGLFGVLGVTLIVVGVRNYKNLRRSV